LYTPLNPPPEEATFSVNTSHGLEDPVAPVGLVVFVELVIEVLSSKVVFVEFREIVTLTVVDDTDNGHAKLPRKPGISVAGSRSVVTPVPGSVVISFPETGSIDI
jgi:hypothetical protein